VRKDLSPGAKIAQSCHALINFREQHELLAKQWIKNSNYIIILEADLNIIYDLLSNAEKYSIVHSWFNEPDMNNEITSIVLEPCEKSKKICQNLKLALS